VTTLESVIPIPGPAGEKGETGLQGIAGTAGTAGASGDPCSACVFLQGTTPGSAQSGNFNISGTGILGALGVGIQPSLGALQFAASTTASGGIVFGADTNLYRSSNNVLRTDDEFHIRTNSNTGLYVQNATGTSNLFIADTSNTRIGIGAIPASSLLTVGTNTTTASGGITFGTDVNLYRSDTNRLRTDDNFTVAGTVNLQPANPLSTAIGAITPGDSYYRWYVEAEGKTWWGDGTNAPDTNLYRSGANTLKTEGNFLIRTGTNSTTALQVQSQAGASLFTADTTGMNVTLNGANNGTVSSWTTSSNTLPAVRAWNTGLTANGYIYSVGGDGLPWGAGNGTSSIYYAKANSNGTIGAWSTSPNSLPNPRYNHTAVISNGYMYVMGGSGSSGTTRDVYYAKLNADGSTGVWTSSPNLLPVGATSATAVAYNGYIYHISGSGPGTAVYYTKVNADGSINAWTTSANPLTAARTEAASVVANGHMYVFGGFNSTYQTTVYYSKINADGSHGAWSASGTGLPVADGRFSTVTANGYVYLIGGQPEATTVRYAPFNSDGSTGSWTNTTSIPATRAFGGATVVNGYIYFMGGESGSSYFNTVYHASTSRIKVGGSLDLVGLGGQNLAEGGSGGSLTAGNTFISGNLQATDQVNFWNGLSVDRELTVGGSALFKTATNSTTAFQIQNAAGTNIFVIDSNAMTITLGSASVTPVLLVLGNKNTTGDPTCTAGALYYNSSATQLRGCAGSSWTSLGENKPAVRVYHNTTQSIPHNTNTTLAFNSERFDTDAMHDTATNNSRLTAKTAGVYIITGTVELDANATGVRTVVISHNGVTPIAIQTVPGIGSNTAQISISAIYNFAVNDFVTLQVYQTSGVALNATGTANYGSEFSMTRIAD
jgi:N-acetylneuraminic acid mutarotase